MSRTYTLVLAQNLGDGSLGNTLDLSAHIADLGNLRWEVDEQLTKLSPGDFTVKIEDYDGSVWAWLQTQTPSAGALFPPFLAFDINGDRAFTGIIAPDRILRDPKTAIVTLTAQDWSVMLAAQALDSWTRPLPMATGNHTAGDSRSVWLWYFSGQQGNQWQLFGSGRGWPNAPIWTSPMPDCVGMPGQANNWLEVGDTVTCPLLPGQSWKVAARHGWDATQGGAFPLGAHTADGTGGYVVELSPPGFTLAFCNATGAPTTATQPPGAPTSWQLTLNRAAKETESRNYYSITKAIGHDPAKPCFELPLDTVDGAVPGDKFQLINSAQSQSWSALQVDAAGKKLITREEVRDLNIGDRIFFTDECLAEVVYEDARAVIKRACLPFSADLSRYTPPSLPIPVLIWLPLRPLTGADLTSVRDMDQGTSTLRVFGSGATAWDGTPEAGWATASGTLPRAYWTNQTLTAPSSLMPDETTIPAPTAPVPLSPASPRRYRATNMAYRMRPFDEEDTANGTTPGTWNPGTVPAVVLYDYLTMRRIQITNQAVTINAWTGSAWGADSTATWPGAAGVKAACVFPGGPSGMVISLASDGLRGVTLPGLSPQTAALAIPANAADAVLKTTPWGAYLVGSKGYGRITYNAGALALAWVDLIAPGAGTLYPGTFAGIDATHVMVAARFDTLNSEGKTVTETHLLLLQPTPTTAKDSLIWDEKILDGAAITMGAMRDPSQAGRAIGHCGGRLFQVSATLPAAYALERFTPSSMTSSELLEHVCQVLQAVAVPNASGTMQIISRSSITTPITLTVDQVSIEDTRAWEHFYSLVRVTGATDDLLYDATGPVNGGKLLEVSRHPLVWSNSGCAAMAEGLAAWFGTPRRRQRQSWFWTNTATAAPWESLQALQRLNVNGDTVTRMLVALEYRPDKGTAQAQLVEV